MKIVEPYAGTATAIDANSRKRRLEALLSAWRFPRLAYWAEPVAPAPGTALSAQELPLWLEILRVAQPVPPRQHLDGLRTWARLRDLRIEDLVRDKAVLIVDDQVAVRSQTPGLGYQVALRNQPPGLGLFGYSWSLLVPARLKGQATEAILRKRFQEVELHGDELIAWSARQNCTDNIAALVLGALTASPADLSRLWKISLALDVEYRFLPALPMGVAEALAKLLGAELEAAAEHLTLERDVRLLRFALGGDDDSLAVPPLPLPPSRFARLLEVDRFFDHARHYQSNWYYDSVASAFARIAKVDALGNALLKLEPGSALISALDAVYLDRPEFIATYVWHSALHAEGAFALLQLPQHMQLAQTGGLELNQEWLQAQQLARELLLFNDKATDWSSLAALGIHDESQAIGRRHYGVALIDRRKAQYDGTALWANAVADAGRGQHYVEALEKHFEERTRHSDAAIIFALRLLGSLRECGQDGLAVRLATAIAGAYVAGLSPDAGFAAIPAVLCAYGELLVGLREALDGDGEAWRRFLRPFDPAEYLELARADQSSLVSTSNSPGFHVPRILRAHAETLVALASASEAFDEPLQAALEIYDADRKAQLYVEAFSWVSLARVTGLQGTPVCEPLFVRVGRLLGRDADNRERLDAFLAAEHPAHILAYVAAGLGGAHPFAEAIRPKLRTLINALLGDPHGVALGHALELASVLQQAGMARDSERLTTRALEIIEDRLPRQAGNFRPIARALLAGALAQQKLWPELLAFEPEGQFIVVSPQARFVENMRALALLESGRPVEAEEVLRWVLEAEPANHVALVNLTALHLQGGDWRKVIDVAERAKPLLTGDDLDHILLNEAAARQHMGDTFGAANLLEGLSAKAQARADVVDARAHLRNGDRTIAPVAPDTAVNGGAEGAPPQIPPAASDAVPTTLALPAKPADVVDVAIITALKEEYEAVRARLTDLQEIPANTGHQYPNLYGWVLGKIPKADGSGAYRVLLAWAGYSGNLRTLITTTRTIDRWHPRYVLFSGIAGGLKKDELRQGDVVVSQAIWYYEYGKVSDGEFKPRHRESFRVDGGLLSSAGSFDSATPAWKKCRPPHPLSDREPKLVLGMIGSGEKVIDDLEPAFVRAILAARPELQAIEMEAAGACVAIEHARDEGKQVGFLMIRGISDMPADAASEVTVSEPALSDTPVALALASPSGTVSRDMWKLHASAISAEFVTKWLASSWWPAQPVL